MVLASLLSLLALAESGQAQPGAEQKNAPRNSIGAELSAINHCVREVRQGPAGSDFDAHVGTQGSMRYVGTEAEIAAFKRCMQLLGFPVDTE
jgi:hypothetical protein